MKYKGLWTIEPAGPHLRGVSEQMIIPRLAICRNLSNYETKSEILPYLSGVCCEMQCKMLHFAAKCFTYQWGMRYENPYFLGKKKFFPNGTACALYTSMKNEVTKNEREFQMFSKIQTINAIKDIRATFEVAPNGEIWIHQVVRNSTNQTLHDPLLWRVVKNNIKAIREGWMTVPQ